VNQLGVEVIRVCPCRAIGSLAVPHGDLVSPPELPADAPVDPFALHRIEPVHVGFFPPCRVKADQAGFHRAASFCHLRIAHPPLLGQPRFNRNPTPLRKTDIVFIFFGFHEKTKIIKALGRGLAGFKPVHPCKFSARFADGAIGVEHVEQRQIVAAPDSKVHRIVGRRHFQTACAELPVHHRIGNNRNLFPGKWSPDVFADQVLIALIVRVHGHRHVTHDGFRARGRNFQVCACFTVSTGCRFDQLIAHPVKLSLLRPHDHFLIAQCSLIFRAPVAHAEATVDVAALVKLHKGIEHAPRIGLIKGKARPIPVTGGTQLAQLLENDAAVLLFPLPSPFDEFFPSEIATIQSFLAQLILNAGLCRDAGMISARKPEGFLALETSPAGEYILQRIVQDVPHVEDSGHIRRRNHDHVRFAV